MFIHEICSQTVRLNLKWVQISSSFGSPKLFATGPGKQKLPDLFLSSNLWCCLQSKIKEVIVKIKIMFFCDSPSHCYWAKFHYNISLLKPKPFSIAYPNFEGETMSLHFCSRENSDIHAKTVKSNQVCSLQKGGIILGICKYWYVKDMKKCSRWYMLANSPLPAEVGNVGVSYDFYQLV